MVIYLLLVAVLGIVIYQTLQNLWIAVGIAGVGEAVLIILYVIDSTKFESSIQNFLEVFNLVGHFDNFTSGILDIQGMVYFLSVAVVFIFLTIQTISKRRWK